MGRNVLIVGAGKSTSYLLDYFLQHAASEKLLITVADLMADQLPQRIKTHPACQVITLDVLSDKERRSTIKKSRHCYIHAANSFSYQGGRRLRCV